MTSRVLAFFLGVAVGAAVLLAVNQGRTVREAEAAVRREIRLREAGAVEVRLRQDLSSLSNRAVSLGRQNEELAARLVESNRKEAAPQGQIAAGAGGVTNASESAGASPFPAAMRDMMRTALKQQVDGKMEALRGRLGLSPAQETSLRGVLERQLDQGAAMAERMFGGKRSPEEKAPAISAPVNVKEEIKSLLSAEQWESYQGYEKEETRRMARLTANAEMMQMQGALQLDEQQQNQVYLILADQAQRQQDPAQMTGKGPITPDQAIRSVLDRKIEALQGVLSPDQVQKYREMQEQQLKLIRSFLPGAGTAGPASPGP